LNSYKKINLGKKIVIATILAQAFRMILL